MMAHRDELIEAGARALVGGVNYHKIGDPAGLPGTMNRLTAAVVIDAVEPLIRADERERIVAELSGPAQESEAMYAHAEAFAARLVEVICEQERGWRNALWELDTVYAISSGQSDQYDACRETSVRRLAERDAARAEAIALRALVPIAYGLGRDDEAAALPMREFDMGALIDEAQHE